MANTVLVTGTIRTNDGTPYEGALIEIYLNTMMTYSGNMYTDAVARMYSNSYGDFAVNLVPSTFDSDRENFYTFKIIKETETIYKKILNGTNPEVDFEDLPDYLPPSQRTPLLGNLNQTANPNPITLPQELIGLFMWQTYEADGSTSVFSAPGEVYFVALNGVVQSSSVDYVKRSTNVIEFINTPVSGDLIAIQYKV